VFWIALFLPPLSITLSWILLLDSDFGLVNQGLRPLASFLGATASTKGPLDIYSFGGIAWTHIVSTDLAFIVMTLSPAFRNMDVSLEEAAKRAGANGGGAALGVFLPLMTPAIAGVTLLACMHGLQSFEVERVLGGPASIDVFSTWVYGQVYA